MMITLRVKRAVCLRFRNNQKRNSMRNLKSHLIKPPFLNNQRPMTLPQPLNRLMRRILLRSPLMRINFRSRVPSSSKYLKRLNKKGYQLTASLKLICLQRRMLRKKRMSKRLNPPLWKCKTQDLFQCHFKKMFPSPTLWRFKDRTNKSPVSRSSSITKRKRKYLLMRHP